MVEKQKSTPKTEASPIYQLRWQEIITYSEVTGAVAVTKIKNPRIMTWAAIAAVLLSFFSKLGAFLQTIPPPVMGGISVILFGTISQKH